jgi:hypothetical protein
VGILLLLCSLPWLLEGQPRSVTGANSVFTTSRTDQYFANEPGLEQPFLRAVRDLAARNCKDVGLYTDATVFEYPLWPLLRKRLGGAVDIEDVAVAGPTAKTGTRRAWRPCAIFAEQAHDNVLVLPRQLEVDGISFSRAWAENSSALLLHGGVVSP